MPRTVTLSSQDVLTWIAEEDLDVFTIDDLVRRFGVARETVHGLVARMARAGRAKRIKRGTYIPLPANYWHRGENEVPLVVDWHLLAKHLAAPDPYFFAYYTAMELHRMIQHPLTTIVIATTVQKPDVELGPVRFHFVMLAERKFAFGRERLQLLPGKDVEVADLDRTFIDAADRPGLCGGIEEVVRGFARRHDDLERERLLRYVVELDLPVVTKRLGFLLEIVGHGDPRLMRELEARARRLGRYKPLVTGGGPMIERDKRWELDINVEPDRLLAAATT